MGSCRIAPLICDRSLNFEPVLYLGQQVSHVLNSKTCACVNDRDLFVLTEVFKDDIYLKL